MTDEDVGQEPCPNSNTLAAQLRNVAQRFATHLTLEDIMRLSLGALSIEAATEIERLESCVRVARNQIHERDDWSIKFAAMKQRAEAAEAELAFRRAGHPPSDTTCDHRHWTFAKHGRVCTCGTFMIDFGD